MIEQIIVYSKEQIEIQFKYSDEMQEMIEAVQIIRERQERKGGICMRCVSYTRTTSCKEDGKIPADIIKQQDQHIQEYLKKQGWTLSAKYCDRKKRYRREHSF